jgi:hypothetical protein
MSNIEGATYTEGAEKNIWTEEGRSDRRLERIA